jgi:hypothetical protein
LWVATDLDKKKKYLGLGFLYNSNKAINTNIFQALDVNGDAPTGVLNNKFYQAIQLYNAITSANEPKFSNVTTLDRGVDGRNTTTAHPGNITLLLGNIPGNKRIKKDGLAAQWLSASNAPFWAEFTDPDPETRAIFNTATPPVQIGGEYKADEISTRGEWGYKQKQDDGVNDQTEKWATSWAISDMLLIARGLEQSLINHGNSPVGGGDAKPHQGHEAGLNMDVRNFFGIPGRNNIGADRQVLRVMAKYGTNIFYNWTDVWTGGSHPANGVTGYTGLFDQDANHQDHYHLDIRRPIISDLNFSNSNGSATFVKIKDYFPPGTSENLTYRLLDSKRNPISWGQDGFATLESGNKVFFADFSGELRRFAGNLVFLPTATSPIAEDLIIEITEKHPNATATNNGANFTYLTTLHFLPGLSLRAPTLAQNVGFGGGNQAYDLVQVQYRLFKLGYRDANGDLVKITGRPSESFNQAIRQFQQALGFPSDGILLAKRKDASIYLDKDYAPRWVSLGETGTKWAGTSFKKYPLRYQFLKDLFQDVVFTMKIRDPATTPAGEFDLADKAAETIYNYWVAHPEFAAHSPVQLAHFIAQFAWKSNRFYGDFNVDTANNLFTILTKNQKSLWNIAVSAEDSVIDTVTEVLDPSTAADNQTNTKEKANRHDYFWAIWNKWHTILKDDTQWKKLDSWNWPIEYSPTVKTFATDYLGDYLIKAGFETSPSFGKVTWQIGAISQSNSLTRKRTGLTGLHVRSNGHASGRAFEVIYDPATSSTPPSGYPTREQANVVAIIKKYLDTIVATPAVKISKIFLNSDSLAVAVRELVRTYPTTSEARRVELSELATNGVFTDRSMTSDSLDIVLAQSDATRVPSTLKSALVPNANRVTSKTSAPINTKAKASSTTPPPAGQSVNTWPVYYTGQSGTASISGFQSAPPPTNSGITSAAAVPSFTKYFDFGQAVSDYILTLPEDAPLTLDALADVVREHIASTIPASEDVLNSLIDVLVEYKEEAQELRFNVVFNIPRSIDEVLDFSKILGDSKWGKSALAVKLNLNFFADFTVGMKLSDLYDAADPTSFLIDDSDIFLAVRKMGLSGEMIIDEEEVQALEGSLQNQFDFQLGLVDLVAKIQKFRFSMATTWTLAGGSEIAISDIEAAAWTNENIGTFTGIIELTSSLSGATGSLLLTFGDNDIFTAGGTTFEISGDVTIPKLTLADLIMLENVKVAYSSVGNQNVLSFTGDSAKFALGGGIEAQVSDSDLTDGTRGISGSYNLSSKALSLSLETVKLKTNSSAPLELTTKNVLFSYNPAQDDAFHSIDFTNFSVKFGSASPVVISSGAEPPLAYITRSGITIDYAQIQRKVSGQIEGFLLDTVLGSISQFDFKVPFISNEIAIRNLMEVGKGVPVAAWQQGIFKDYFEGKEAVPSTAIHSVGNIYRAYRNALTGYTNGAGVFLPGVIKEHVLDITYINGLLASGAIFGSQTLAFADGDLVITTAATTNDNLKVVLTTKFTFTRKTTLDLGLLGLKGPDGKGIIRDANLATDFSFTTEIIKNANVSNHEIKSGTNLAIGFSTEASLAGLQYDFGMLRLETGTVLANNHLRLGASVGIGSVGTPAITFSSTGDIAVQVSSNLLNTTDLNKKQIQIDLGATVSNLFGKSKIVFDPQMLVAEIAKQIEAPTADVYKNFKNLSSDSFASQVKTFVDWVDSLNKSDLLKGSNFDTGLLSKEETFHGIIVRCRESRYDALSG